MPTNTAVAYLNQIPAAIPAGLPKKAPTPIVKWVGGKGKLMSQLLPLLPAGSEKMRHVEPFVGGGAMFFARRPKRALLCDINQDLVNTYTMVRDQLQAVVDALDPLAREHSKEHYYAIRERYNEDTSTNAERAAMFIYLNKTCFNGLHRVNKRGKFNVPAGRYKNPRILDIDGLLAANYQLQQAEVIVDSFEALLENARPGDFVYLDPPYEPVSRTANFTSYARNGFSQTDQTRLRDVFAELTRRGCKCMLSNSDVPFIRELYADFHIDQVAAARAINCNAKRRGLVSEVVVRNYKR